MHRSLWRHFSILCLIAFLYCVVGATLMWHARDPLRVTWNAALWAGIVDSPERIAIYFALMAGISVGTSRLGSRGVKSAAGVLLATTVLMIVIDMWINPAFTRANQRAARTYREAWPLASDTVIYSPLDTLGVIRTAARLVRDRPAALNERLGASWRQDHPRELATNVAVKLPLFLLPFITMGLVLGAVTWQRRRLIFRTPRDESVARWCTAWVLAPAAWAMLLDFSSMHYAVLHHYRPYWWPLFRYLPFAIIAVLGWRAAARTSDADVILPAR
jgi:hypothetical protein